MFGGMTGAPETLPQRFEATIVVDAPVADVWGRLARFHGVEVTAADGTVRYLGRDTRWWTLDPSFPYVGRHGSFVPGGGVYVYEPEDRISLPWPPDAGEIDVIALPMTLDPGAQGSTELRLSHVQPDMFTRVANEAHWRRVVRQLHEALGKRT